MRLRAALLFVVSLPFVACGGGEVTGYPVGVFIPGLRRPWLLATLGLHAGIAACMGLWLFSLVMMVLNVAAFGIRAEPRSSRVDDGVLPRVSWREVSVAYSPR